MGLNRESKTTNAARTLRIPGDRWLRPRRAAECDHSGERARRTPEPRPLLLTTAGLSLTAVAGQQLPLASIGATQDTTGGVVANLSMVIDPLRRREAACR